MIDQAAIDEIRARVDLVMLVGQTVALKKRGADFWGACPFHAEKTASFKVDSKGFYKCFGCGAGGDAFKWVETTKNLSFPEAVEYLSNGKFKVNGHAPNGHAAPQQEKLAALQA